MSLLTECPYWPNVLINCMFLLSECPYWPNVLITRMSLLTECSYWPNVLINRMFVLNESKECVDHRAICKLNVCVNRWFVLFSDVITGVYCSLRVLSSCLLTVETTTVNWNLGCYWNRLNCSIDWFVIITTISKISHNWRIYANGKNAVLDLCLLASMAV